MKKNCLSIILLAACLFLWVETVKAEGSDTLTIGRSNLLQVKVHPGGTYCIYRNGSKQLYGEKNTPVFAMKIKTGKDSILYSSAGDRKPEGYLNIFYYQIPKGFDSIVDVSAVTKGIQQHVTKKFWATYKGYSFSATIKIMYNTSVPDYIIQEATIDASNIPVNSDISFAYGWDTFIAGSDVAEPLILPDVNKYYETYNNSKDKYGKAYAVYPDSNEVQSLHFLGAYNQKKNVVMGFFPIGQSFSGIYSGNPRFAYCFNMINYPANSQQLIIPAYPLSYLDDNKRQFLRYYSDTEGDGDNGIGIAYHNIQPGKITTLQTGIAFTERMDGVLDYEWSNSKNQEADLGDDIDLNLKYTNYDANDVLGAAFRIDFPGLQVRGAREPLYPANTISIDDSCEMGNNYYLMKSLSVLKSASTEMTIPLTVKQAGQWSIDGNTITGMTKTMPLSAPAVLTVKTEVNFSSGALINLCKNSEQAFTVQYPTGITAAEDVVINIEYSGDLTSFNQLPPTVTIPANQNSAMFTVKSTSSAINNGTLSIVLNSSDKAFVQIGNANTANVAVLNLTEGTIGSDQAICYNTKPAKLTETGAPIGATGIYTYQWQYSTDNGKTWTPAGGTNNDKEYEPAELLQNTMYRRFETSDICSAFSNTVTIIVYDELKAGSITAPQSICYNTQPAMLTTQSGKLPSGGDTTKNYEYQWQSSRNGLTHWTNISGATGEGYLPPVLTDTTYYRRELKRGLCNPVYCDPVQITVYPVLKAGKIGYNSTSSTQVSICQNVIPNVLTQVSEPSGGSGTYRYQWQYSEDEGTTWKSAEGKNNEVKYTSILPLTKTALYRRAVISEMCDTVYSDSIRLTMIPLQMPEVAITVVPALAVCENTKITLTANSKNSGSAPTYKWTIDGKPFGGNLSSFDYTVDWKNRQSKVSCTLIPSSEIVCVNSSAILEDVKQLRVSSCTVPVNPHLRGRIYK